MDALTALRALRAPLSDEPLNALVGRFHAHIGVAPPEPGFEALHALCRAHRWKLTVVDLENGARRQQDVMLTSHYVDPGVGAAGRIADHLLDLSAQVASACRLLRIKLEHTSTPSLAVYDAAHYHEVHVKLRIRDADYARTMDRLRDMGAVHGFVPSRNPRQRLHGDVLQFVNLRIYEDTRERADVRVAALVEVLSREGYAIATVKRETVVFDTGHHLDAWWA